VCTTGRQTNKARDSRRKKFRREMISVKLFSQGKGGDCSTVYLLRQNESFRRGFANTRTAIYRVRINYQRISLRHNLSRKCRKIVKFM
jgi:hypothetical protein